MDKYNYKSMHHIIIFIVSLIVFSLGCIKINKITIDNVINIHYNFDTTQNNRKYKKDTVPYHFFVSMIGFLIFLTYSQTRNISLVFPLLSSFMLTCGTTLIIKSMYNVKRPDFRERCTIGRNKSNNNINNGIVKDVCKIDLLTKNEKYNLVDGYNSFPSGHCSSAFSLLFFTIFLYYKIDKKDKKDKMDILMTVISIILLFIPFTRCKYVDNKHTFIDIAGGFLIALLYSTICLL